MRLTDKQIDKIRVAVDETVANAKVKIFGSRLDDSAKGGDIDILVILADETIDPALVAATISAKAMIKLGGQKVDVLVDAPHLKELEIHRIAKSEGVLI